MPPVGCKVGPLVKGNAGASARFMWEVEGEDELVDVVDSGADCCKGVVAMDVYADIGREAACGSCATVNEGPLTRRCQPGSEVDQ